MNLDRLFHEDFGEFPYLLWSECGILFWLFKSLNNKVTQYHWPKSSAIVVLDDGRWNKTLTSTHTWRLWVSPSTDASPFYMIMNKKISHDISIVRKLEGKRTISKELTRGVADLFGFWIVIIIEKYIIVCLEIGGQKTGHLWEPKFSFFLWVSLIWIDNTNQSTHSEQHFELNRRSVLVDPILL